MPACNEAAAASTSRARPTEPPSRQLRLGLQWVLPAKRLSFHGPSPWMQFRPLALLVGALTGVSVAFSPVFLFYLGGQEHPSWIGESSRVLPSSIFCQWSICGSEVPCSKWRGSGVTTPPSALPLAVLQARIETRLCLWMAGQAERQRDAQIT